MNKRLPQYVVGIGTLALINAGLAQAKNRGALGWFLLTLVLGPIATLLIVVLPREGPPGSSRPKGKFDLESFRQQ